MAPEGSAPSAVEDALIVRRPARITRFRLFDTLSSRLILLVVLALLLAQIISVLTFVRGTQRDESERRGDEFVRTLGAMAQLFNSQTSIDRQSYVFNFVQPGFQIWLNVAPAVTEPGVRVDTGGPHVPIQWVRIPSPDKRLEWFPDTRPLVRRYSISPLMVMRNVATGFGGGPPPGEPPPENAASRPPDTHGPPPPPNQMSGNRLPPPRRGPPIDRPIPHYTPSPEDDYGPATTILPPPRNAHTPPVRWRASIRLDDGVWLNAEYLYDRGLPSWMTTVMYQNGLILALMLLFTVTGIGYATRRLSEIARAADKLGRGEETAALAETGTREMRHVTQAFNQMSFRLRRFVQGRTQMLAGISHDMRTPLTGLRLRAELVDDDENRERMLALVDEMTHLTRSTLVLGRDESFTEKSDVVDVSTLAASICDNLKDAGIDVTLDPAPRIDLMCRPHSLRRAIRNLAENGVKYGKRSRIRLQDNREAVRITIDDDGPGIPEDRIEQAFRPFVRLEGADNRATGTGLGLAITRSIILNHGGDITLMNRPEGGLRATITLPKSKAG